jgi:5'-nucleotidase
MGQAAFRVEGTPVDCVRLALERLWPAPDWVISGINAGGNLGTDLLHSGTAAAAREAALRGRPAVAVSHYIHKGHALDWLRAAAVVRVLLAELMAMPLAEGFFWNVNLPHPLPADAALSRCFCPVDPSPLPLAYRWEGESATYEAVYRERPRRPGCDVDLCFGGRATVSLVPAAGA